MMSVFGFFKNVAGKIHFAKVMVIRGHELGGIKYALLEWADSKRVPQYSVSLIDGNFFRCTNCGELNPDKHICVVQLEKEWLPTAGFCALFNRTLNGLYFADKNSLVPVVDEWIGAPYEEKKEINGSRGVFEYYFRQPSDISLEEAKISRNVVFTSHDNIELALKDTNIQAWYNPTEEYIQTMATVVEKYIRFRPEIVEKLEKDLARLKLSSATLGIHFRGTDYQLDVLDHPGQYSIDAYFTEIDKLMEQYDFNDIFLATDDENVLNYFLDRYKTLKFYTDTKRVGGRESVAFTINDRELDHYLSGYEIIRDIYTLCKCKALLGGLSQVVVTSRIIKSSQKEEYKPLVILETPISTTGVLWTEYYKTMLDEENISSKNNCNK